MCQLKLSLIEIFERKMGLLGDFTCYEHIRVALECHRHFGFELFEILEHLNDGLCHLTMYSLYALPRGNH